MSVPFCGKCGAAWERGRRYCGSCGATPTSPCRFIYRSDSCGYDGPMGECPKYLDACRQRGNEARFGGYPLPLVAEVQGRPAEDWEPPEGLGWRIGSLVRVDRPRGSFVGTVVGAVTDANPWGWMVSVRPARGGVGIMCHLHEVTELGGKE